MPSTMSRAQFNAVARAFAVVLGPAFTQAPYLAPEIFEGDVVDYSSGVSSGTLSSMSILLDGVNEGSTFTAPGGSAGRTLVGQQTATAPGGATSTGSSSPVTIRTVPTFKSLGYLGGNVSNVTSSGRAFMFSNAAFDGRTLSFIGDFANSNAINYTTTLTFSATSGTGITATASGPGSTGAFPSSSQCIGEVLYLDQGKAVTITGWTSTSQITVTIPVALSRNYVKSWFRSALVLDSNGWPAQTSPAQPCQHTLSAGSNTTGTYGPLPPSTALPDGVYHCSYKSVGQATVVSAGTFSGSTGVTVTNIVNQLDGVTTTFDLTVPSTGYVVLLNFTNGFHDLVVVRNGALTLDGQGRFASEALAHYSQFYSLRWMDFMKTNGNLVTDLADRPYDWPTFSQQPYSYEILIDFINAIAAYPGSKLGKVHITLPALASVGYCVGVANILNARGISSSIKLRLEKGNEDWNLAAFSQGGVMLSNAVAEANVLANYAISPSMLSSVVSDGATPSNITVTTVNALSTYVDQTSGQPYMVNGAAVRIDDETFANRSSNGQTSITVTGANTFTYVAKGNVPTATAFVTGSNPTQWAAFFNLSSNLVVDGMSFNLFQLLCKYQTRDTYLCQQAWATVRPQDDWLVGVQQYGGRAQGSTTSEPIHFAYGNWLSDVWFGSGDGSKPLSSWCYGMCAGDYITAATSTDVDATFTQMGAQTSPGTYTGALLTANYCNRGHVATCRKWRVHPITYEGAPDNQNTASINVALSQDARMGTLVANILDAWFQNGGEEFHFYSITPATFSNAAQGSWQALEYFGQSSPKINALLNYSTLRNYVNDNGAPGTQTLSFYQRVAGTGSFISGTNGMMFWTVNTSDRYLDFAPDLPRARRYAIKPKCSDSVGTNTPLQVWVNGVHVGTSHMPPNGPAAGSGATQATPVLDPIVMDFAAGLSSVSFFLPSGVGTSPGILELDMVPV